MAVSEIFLAAFVVLFACLVVLQVTAEVFVYFFAITAFIVVAMAVVKVTRRLF